LDVLLRVVADHCVTGTVLLETANGNELFYPVLALLTGDLMELLPIARIRSANFNRLDKPCWVCGKSGPTLDELNGDNDPLRSIRQTDEIIGQAIQLMRDNRSMNQVQMLLKPQSLLCVRVRTVVLDFFTQGFLTAASCICIESIGRSSTVLNHFAALGS
jgi:hypothetical protein